ncbi:MAG: bacillithiol biosynthesis cysteine-adding enzyme BshC [bacterium]|nr:bacillithiol biosynthesis cysteine-adding enzyme BshC [bacterium]
MPKSIAFHRLPGTNALFLDYLENFDKVKQFYSNDYRQNPNRWDTVQQSANIYKEDLVEGLLESARHWECRKQALKNIELLRKPETLAVMTGQQAGLFGGPLYTYFKALSAVLWAKEIQRLTGRPTVPIFWMESSDHDFFEVNHIRLLNQDGEEITLSISGAPKEKRRIVGGITFNGEIEQLIQRLWTLLPANTYRGPHLEMLGSFYKPGNTFGDAFAGFYSYLFSEDGLIFFDAQNDRCKRAALPLLDRILEASPKLNGLLEESSKTVLKAGYPPQIHPQKDRLQLFFREGEVRIPISTSGELFYDDKPPEAVGFEELRRRAAAHPELFMPKVSLRPILQDFLFPTAAYIAGPAEIAYFAQLKPLYQQLGVKMPAIIPRLSLTLIEAKIEKILDKYNFTPEELRQGPQALIAQKLESDPGNDLVGLFAQVRQQWEEIHDRLTFGMMRIDPTLQHPVEKTMERWLQGLDVLEEKAKSALSRKNETFVQQINKCCTHLSPGGSLHERRYSVQYYLARYGRALTSKIRSQAQLDLYRHQLIFLGEEE